jgi:hypothetical protein
VTSTGSGSERDPIDPVFASLFRPEDEPAGYAEVERTSYEDEPMFESIVDPVVDPRIEESYPAEDAPEADPEPGPVTSFDAEPVDEDLADPAAAVPVPSAPLADTGRLFRSQGAVGHDDAVLALSSDHFGRLRTLQRSRDSAPEPVLPLVDAGPLDAEALDADAAAFVAVGGAAKEVVVDEPRRSRRSRRNEGERAAHRSRSITGGAVYLVVIGVTVLVGFANALLASGDIGWPTGLALLASSVYAALTVRREDDIVAIIVPPIAFLVAALTAGQLFLGSAEGSLLNRAVVVFFTLADNWFWIIGATLASLVIVLVRRRRT